jgi:hypothetical protein
MADGATGALAGFAGINPWVGLGMMGASAITSGIQAISRGSKAKKLEADFDRLDKSLQPVSPEQYAYLNRVRQLERGMRMGTDPTTAMARRGLGQSLAQTQTNIARVGGGPSTVSGLLRAQQGYNVGMGNVAAQAGQQADRMLMFQQPLIDNIQNRIYDLQMKRRNYAQMKAVAMREGAQDAASAAVGALAQGATMIPKYNENIDTSKLDQGTKAATQAANQTMAQTTPTQSYYGGGMIGNRYVRGISTPSLSGQFSTPSYQADSLSYTKPSFNLPNTPIF